MNAVLERWRDANALDDALADNIAAARATASADIDIDPWTELILDAGVLIAAIRGRTAVPTTPTSPSRPW